MGDEINYTVTDAKPDLLHIEEMFVFIAQDDDGNEGVCAFHSDGIGWIPMVAADFKRVESLRKHAEALVRQTGQKIVLARFKTREELEVIE